MAPSASSPSRAPSQGSGVTVSQNNSPVPFSQAPTQIVPSAFQTHPSAEQAGSPPRVGLIPRDLPQPLRFTHSQVDGTAGMTTQDPSGSSMNSGVPTQTSSGALDPGHPDLLRVTQTQPKLHEPSTQPQHSSHHPHNNLSSGSNEVTSFKGIGEGSRTVGSDRPTAKPAPVQAKAKPNVDEEDEDFDFVSTTAAAPPAPTTTTTPPLEKEKKASKPRGTGATSSGMAQILPIGTSLRREVLITDAEIAKMAYEILHPSGWTYSKGKGDWIYHSPDSTHNLVGNHEFVKHLRETDPQLVQEVTTQRREALLRSKAEKDRMNNALFEPKKPAASRQAPAPGPAAPSTPIKSKPATATTAPVAVLTPSLGTAGLPPSTPRQHGSLRRSATPTSHAPPSGSGAAVFHPSDLINIVRKNLTENKGWHIQNGSGLVDWAYLHPSLPAKAKKSEGVRGQTWFEGPEELFEYLEVHDPSVLREAEAIFSAKSRVSTSPFSGGGGTQEAPPAEPEPSAAASADHGERKTSSRRVSMRSAKLARSTARKQQSSERNGSKKRRRSSTGGEDSEDEEDEDAVPEDPTRGPSGKFILEKLVTFKTLFDHLRRNKGWRYQDGRRTVNWYYLPPGKKKEGGQRGVDYFASENAVFDFVALHKEHLEGLILDDGTDASTLEYDLEFRLNETFEEDVSPAKKTRKRRAAAAVAATSPPTGKSGRRPADDAGSASSSTKRARAASPQHEAPELEEPPVLPVLGRSTPPPPHAMIPSSSSSARRVKKSSPAQVFKGIAVLVLGFDASGGPLVTAEYLKELVVSGGGQIVRSLDGDLPEGCHRVEYVTRPGNYRSEPFLAALSLGKIPLHWLWLVDSRGTGMLLPSEPYALPVGLKLPLPFSPESFPFTPSFEFKDFNDDPMDRPKPLRGTRFAVIGDERTVNFWQCLGTELGGAFVEDEPEPDDYVVVAAEDDSEETLERCAHLTNVVSFEWMVQCLLTGTRVKPTLHPKLTACHARASCEFGAQAKRLEGGTRERKSGRATQEEVRSTDLPESLRDSTRETLVIGPPVTRSVWKETFSMLLLGRRRFEIGDYVFVRDHRWTHEEALADPRVGIEDLRLGRILSIASTVPNEEGAEPRVTVKMNRLQLCSTATHRPRIVLDARESMEVPADALVAKFVCVPVQGWDAAKEMLTDRIVTSETTDWRDRVYVLAL